MRKVKVMMFIFATIVACLLVGCVTEEDQTEDNLFLDTPTNVHVIDYSNVPYVFFDAVKNAEGYQINIFTNNKLTKRVEVLPTEAALGVGLDDLVDGDYYVNVKALAGNSKYLDSAVSENVNFSVTGSGNVSTTKYTVTFDTKGGSFITSQIVSKGATATKPNDPTRSGYEFVGWFLDGVEYDFSLPVEANITITASWQKVNGSDDDKLVLSSYYKTAEGLSGTALKTKLREIISVVPRPTSYDGLRSTTSGLPFTDADPENPNNIILFYGHVSVNNSSSNWNREHVWPKSLAWYKNSGAGSDIHHLRPENERVNSTRNNLVMGMAASGKSLSYSNGMPAGKYSSTYFEPIDEVKGDVARIYLYMMVRYSETDTKYPITNAIQSFELLLEWNRLDPVDEFEKIRNERSYQVQGNRNPFIDYPEFVEMIWG